MGGVGEELALLAPGLFHRAGGPPGEHHGDTQQQKQRRQGDLQIGVHHLLQGGLLHGHVHKGDVLVAEKAVVLAQVPQAVLPHHALRLVLGQAVGEDVLEFLGVVEVGIGAGGDGGHVGPVPLLLHHHGEIGQEHLVPADVDADVRPGDVRGGGGLVDDPLEHLAAEGLDVLAHGHVHRAEHHRQDCGHQNHADGHEF